MRRTLSNLRGPLAAGFVAVTLAGVAAQQGSTPAAAPAAGQWRTYGGDLASTRYSALDQITAENFGTLRVAWRFRTDPFGPRPEIQLQTTPLFVNGALYASVG